MSKLSDIIEEHGFTEGDGKTSLILLGDKNLRKAAEGLTAAFDPSKHPREPGGSSKGGRWAVKGVIGNTEFVAHEGQVYAVNKDAPLTVNGMPQGRWESSETHWDNWKDVPGTMQQEATAQLVEAEAQVAPSSENLFTDAYPDASAAPDTQAIHKTGGVYPAARVEQVHAPYLLDALKDAQPVDGQAMTLFTAGGGGSGKSTLLDQRLGGGPPNSVLVNPDEAKKWIPEYQEMVAAGDVRAAAHAHEESSDMAKELLTTANGMNANIVVDGTGNANPGKFLGKIHEAEALGRKTKVVMVDIPTEEAVSRAVARANNPNSGSYGRLPDLNVLRTAHRTVTQRHLEWRDKVDNWEVWANDSPETQRVIAYRANGSEIVVVDKERYDQMLRKAGQ